MHAFLHLLRLGSVLVLLVSALSAGPLQLMSTRSAALPRSATATGDSFCLGLSADGNRLLLVSDAPDLGPLDNNGALQDLFVHDQPSGATWLVSARWDGQAGGNQSTTYGSLTREGRHVVFEATASDLVSVADTNGSSDVFVRDLDTATTTLVSINAEGSGPGTGESFDASISSNGRYVAFVSSAPDLVSNDTNGIPDVFLRDLGTGVTRLVSVGAAPISGAGSEGVMMSPQVSDDGRWVTFWSAAGGLVPGVTNGFAFVRDMVAGTTTLATTNVTDAVPDLVSQAVVTRVYPSAPLLCPDGQSFVCTADIRYALTGSTNPHAFAGALVHVQIASGQTRILGTNVAEEALGITPDGRYVVGSVQNESGGSVVHRWDTQTGTSIPISVYLDGEPAEDAVSVEPTISADGRWVVFVSDALDLVTNGVSGEYQVYRTDVQNGTTVLASPSLNDTGEDGVDSAIPCVSDDGCMVAFDAFAGTFAVGDLNDHYDVFIRDLCHGTPRVVSRRSGSSPGSVSASGSSRLATRTSSGSLGAAALSAEGRYAVFESLADDLLPGDTNAGLDVFLHDRITGSNRLVSASAAGPGPGNGQSFDPAITPDGRFVCFLSHATDLCPNATNAAQINAFRFDTLTGTTVLISTSNGVHSVGCTAVELSDDGQRAAFLSGQGLHYRNLAAGTTEFVSRGAYWFALSPDGRYLAYQESRNRSGLVLADMQSAATPRVFDLPAGSAAFSGDSGRMIIASAGGASSTNALLRVYSLATDSVQTVPLLTNQSRTLFSQETPHLSRDGRYVAFVTSLAIAEPYVGTNAQHVYLHDTLTDNLTWITAAASAGNAATEDSTGVQISADGRLVSFSSRSSALVTGDSNAWWDAFAYDRWTGETRRLSSVGSPTRAPLGLAGAVCLSPDGSAAAFTSSDPALVAGDLNGALDAFIAPLEWPGFSDTDSDGMPDAWEVSQFGSLIQNGDGDADGDGVPDRAESVAGTEPGMAESYPRLSVTTRDAGTIRFEFPAAPGRSYRLQTRAEAVATEWTDLPALIFIAGDRATATVANGEDGARFFRLSIRDGRR